MSTLFQGMTLIDGKGGEPLANAAILVEKGRISQVGPREAISAPPEAEVVELGGKHVIPGMIDCHTHIELHGMADSFQENLVEEKLRTLRAAREMEDTLKAGFTTIRNVGCINYIDMAVKSAIELGYCQGPRILSAGKIIQMTCSGAEYFSGMYRTADGADDCRKAAREQLAKGADLLKLMATGAVMNPGGVPGAPQFEVEEMRVVVEEGLKVGKHTAAHAHAAQGILNAVKAGVRTIEHGTMATPEAIEAMAKAGTYLVPTMSLHELFEAHADEVPDFMVQKSRGMQAAYIDIVKNFKAAGVPIAMGTDAGTNYNYHGNNAAEIVYFVNQGIMSPMEAIQAATKVAAEAIMLDGDVGTLAPGKLADLVVLEGDPLQDISIVGRAEKIAAVYKGGALAG